MTYITLKGIRYKVEGTGYPYATLTRMIKSGEAEVIDQPKEEKE